MRIGFIAPTSIPSRRANTVQVMKMAQAMQNVGHEVRVISPMAARNRDDHRDRGWDSLARHYGLQSRFEIEWLLANPLFRGYDYALHAVRMCRTWGAELVYTRLPQSAALASMVGLPCVYEVHDIPHSRMAKFLLNVFLHSRGARRLVVITRALQSDLLACINSAQLSKLSLVASDGVDLARFANLPEPGRARGLLFAKYGLRLPDTGFVAGYTGHLYPGRGTDILLDLAQRLPEVHFLIAGGEPQEVGDYSQRIQSAGQHNLTLTGFIPNQELPMFQAACDILMMPYQKNVAASSGGDIGAYLSPMKLFEYLACGRAILSGDIPVLREILDEKNSILLPPDDVSAWEQAIRSLAADQPRRVALANRARLDASKYTWEARVNKILNNLEDTNEQVV